MVQHVQEFWAFSLADNGRPDERVDARSNTTIIRGIVNKYEGKCYKMLFAQSKLIQMNLNLFVTSWNCNFWWRHFAWSPQDNSRCLINVCLLFFVCSFVAFFVWKYSIIRNEKVQAFVDHFSRYFGILMLYLIKNTIKPKICQKC